MKILWITNVELNDISRKYGREVVVGGWLEQTSQALLDNPGIELLIACRTDFEYCENIGESTYYSIPKKESDLCKRLEFIFKEADPDIIHIWGTEYIQSLYAVKILSKLGMLDRTIISIQGLVSVIPIHYYASLPNRVIRNKTFKELFFKKNIKAACKEMEKRGQNEIETYKLAKHCIGRTDWDYACIKQINENINYHFCNETLRKEFYEQKWYYQNCKRNSIFFGQANYPLKGFHSMIEALRIVKTKFPDVILSVLGNDVLKKPWYRRSSYDEYLKSLIEKYELRDNIRWLGVLCANDMVNQYLSANVYVNASSIENSSNSICEAMLLGVPIVASDVGGVKSFINHNQSGMLYQESAYYMLANCVIDLFGDANKAIKLGEAARQQALIKHDVNANKERLLEIYDSLIMNQ